MVNKIMCSFEGGYAFFQRCVNLDAQKQWTGLGSGQDKPFTKKVTSFGRDYPL